MTQPTASNSQPTASNSQPPATSHQPPSLNPEIFKAYDIRGIVGKTLTPAIVRVIGQALGSLARESACDTIAIGRDGRLSGPELCDALSDGSRMSGGLTDRNGIPFGTWQFRFIDWARDLGFLQKPGLETKAAKDVASYVANPPRPAGPGRGGAGRGGPPPAAGAPSAGGK